MLGRIETLARILYVTEGYCTHDRRFLQRITDAGHEVWFAPLAASAVQIDLPGIDAPVHWLPPLTSKDATHGNFHWVAALRCLRRAVRETAPDLIHAGPVHTGGLLAASTGFHPLVVMSWGSDVLINAKRSGWQKRITKFSLQRADIAVADCEVVRQKTVELSGIPESRIVSFPWGVDLKHFQRKISALQLRGQFDWGNCTVVISARSLEPHYGSMTFLGAMKEVLAQRPDVRVLMLGAGTLRGEAESFIERNGLIQRIHFAGRVPEETLPDYFAEADLYVSAAPCDGSSVTLLQAMACGLPVIVADSYGNREWVKDGENGWLFPAGATDALAKKILCALQTHSGRQVAGRINVQIAQKRADWSRNSSMLLNAYDELLEHRTVRRVRHAQLQSR